MYRFYLNNINNDYHYGELIRVFIPDDSFEVICIDWIFDDYDCLGDKSFLINASASADRDTIKRELYEILCSISGRRPEWGTLTGVRPLKLATELYNQYLSIEVVKNIMSEKYLISDEKLKLLTDTLDYQIKHVNLPVKSIGLYVGIPFCPTRCAYCSFASNVANEDTIQEYMDKLHEEIRYTAKLIKENNTHIESVYIGGGTPTTLNAMQLDKLLSALEEEVGIVPQQIEFTVEAGRPDTITEEKLAVLREHQISRISINPQTMKDETLVKIGRRHTAYDIEKAYELSRKFGFEIVNADLIAGLPGETLDDFNDTLDKVLKLGANNITIHTLSVKKGSILKENDPEYYRYNNAEVAQMLAVSQERLRNEGFYPYYIYRQKHQIGSFENVGYCKEGTHSIYNIRIMEEKQTIIALGAGGIGKLYFPAEDRLERIANVSNYQVYIERFDEMLARKNNYYGG